MPHLTDWMKADIQKGLDEGRFAGQASNYKPRS